MTIDYSWGELEIYSRPVESVKCFSWGSNDEFDGIGMDIEPDDIDLTDTVTVVWSIK